MPRTMLTDQHWQKLKVILRNLSILLKLFSIELEQAVRGEIFLLVLVIQTLFSNVLIVGQAAVSYLDYSNY
ncbi:hypothetical protein Asch03_03261 [Acinetobacter schindleri]|nr:Uncharacterised protein [Acinetobacter haemolyticus]